MRTKIQNQIQIFLLACLFLYCIPAHSKPTWFEPGVYVEYRIVNALASPLEIACSVDFLEPLGVLHRYGIGNHTVFSDLGPDEFRQWVEKRDNFTEKLKQTTGSTYSILLSRNFSSRVLELFKSGNLSANTRIPDEVSGVGYVSPYPGIMIYNASYSWWVLGFKNSLAEVKVRFNGSIGEYLEVKDFNRTLLLVNKSIDQTFTVLIDPDTREAFTHEGEYLGVVPFWVTDLIPGQNVTVLSFYNSTIGGVVSGDYEIKTPLGVFKSYIITRTERTVTFPGMRAVCFDRVKGILLSTSYGYSDPILLRFMNISFIYLLPTRMEISRLEHIEPPREIIPRELMLGLLGLAMLGAALLVLLFIRFRRKQLMKAQADNQNDNTLFALHIGTSALASL